MDNNCDLFTLSYVVVFTYFKKLLMENKYSITAKNIFHAINETMIYVVISVLAIIALYAYIFKEDPGVFFFLTFLILAANTLIFILPVLILYQNYQNYNRNTILVVKHNVIIIDKEILSLKEIKKFNIHATHQHFSRNNGVTSLPYNDYFYYIEIVLNNGKKRYATSLLGYNLDKELQKKYPSIPVKNVITSYPLIKDSGRDGEN